MRTFILTAAIACLSFVSKAQNNNDIFLTGKVDTLYSKTLGEQRKIWIYSPTMKPGNAFTGERFPVLYLLDGDVHFESLVAMIRQLSEIDGNTNFPPMIVVGILNTDRTRDLTPTHIKNDLPMMDSAASINTGGNEKFITFMQYELMLHIDSLYPTQPYRLLIGHSFGGLTAMNILTNHTNMFNAYIAIDPSMWYGHETFLKATEQKLLKQKFAGIKLYIGMANTKPEDMTLEKMKNDTTDITRHMRSIFALDNFIRKNTNDGLTYASNYYADDDHGSVPFISEYEGLRFIFKDYKLKLSFAEFTDSSTAIIKKFQDHYKELSKQFGYTILPPQDLIYNFGLYAMSSGFFTKAEALFKMNLENYPNNENSLAAYAALYAAKKDTANAVLFYQRAYNINKSPEIMQLMNGLQGKNIFKISADTLKEYTGVYEFQTVAVTATVYLKDTVLWISSPGQGEMELVPVEKDIFVIKNKTGYTLHFEMNCNKPAGLVSIQPNGTFQAILKE
ncbi:MAG: alpha/beta hydrolase-fold protein [Chitinophagaceae bacterium]